ncbi:hypothetical protein EWM64_g6082 [Hericium alpestre]|uniref:Major facilitator superfamily (MFS) profile domain-containing protein n=1 Tax=Hericium alpestre TaxID=135208 RepID=A0A4Y9ZVM2_9AGAM|nr:hypothetical protein EWM64_g6082 [Hericium alpestre]
MSSPVFDDVHEKADGSPCPRSVVKVDKRAVDVAALFLQDFDGANEVELNAEEAEKLRRKIDWHLMPLMCILYLMTFADKTTLGQSAVLGIHLEYRQSAHLDQTQFNWLGTVFYVAYLAFQYPQGWALQHFPAAKWMCVNIVVWAIALLCHAACRSFGALLVVRIIMGVCEGAIASGFLLVTGMFYTRAEQVERVGYWCSMNGVAAVLLGLMGFGVLHIHTSSFKPWQWLTTITGVLTLVVALAFWIYFPDSPTSAWFLTPAERAAAVHRIRANQTGVENKVWKREQFVETLTDPKTWVFALFSIVTQLLNSLTNQRQIIVNQFGFDTIDTTLVGCVDGVVQGMSHSLLET